VSIVTVITQLVTEAARFIKIYQKTKIKPLLILAITITIIIVTQYLNQLNQHVHTNKDNTNNHFTYVSSCKNNSNKNSTSFMKTILPLINTFITQLMKKIIENLPVIINSLNQNTHGSP
jgi:hypothetical protein